MATKQTPAKSGSLPPKEEFVELIRRAEQGDESTLPGLRALFHGDHADFLIQELGGDMARTAERSMVARAAGKNLARREALQRKLAALRAELAGPDPTPIERLLAERAALCWLAVFESEAIAAQQPGPISIESADYQQRLIDRAHKRFLTALKTLAAVKRLAVPALQVNIGRNQRINRTTR